MLHFKDQVITSYLKHIIYMIHLFVNLILSHHKNDENHEILLDILCIKRITDQLNYNFTTHIQLTTALNFLF
jgi:hypothetical protein